MMRVQTSLITCLVPVFALALCPSSLATKGEDKPARPQLELVEFTRGKTDTIMQLAWVVESRADFPWTVTAMNDESQHRGYVQISGEELPSPLTVYLPLRGNKSTSKVNGARRHSNGDIIVTGNEKRPSGSELPSIWILRAGSSLEAWEQRILDTRMFRKGTRPVVTRILRLFGFEHDSDRMVCAAVAGGTDMGTAYVRVHFQE